MQKTKKRPVGRPKSKLSSNDYLRGIIKKSFMTNWGLLMIESPIDERPKCNPLNIVEAFRVGHAIGIEHGITVSYFQILSRVLDDIMGKMSLYDFNYDKMTPSKAAEFILTKEKELSRITPTNWQHDWVRNRKKELPNDIVRKTRQKISTVPMRRRVSKFMQIVKEMDGLAYIGSVATELKCTDAEVSELYHEAKRQKRHIDIGIDKKGREYFVP